MGDLSVRRRPMEQANSHLKQRQIQLRIMQLEAEKFRIEVTIEEIEVQIATHQETIDGLDRQINEMKAELVPAEAKAHV